MVSATKTNCLGKTVIDLLSKEKTNAQRSNFFRLVTSVKSVSTKLSFGVVTSIGNILYLNVLVKIRLSIQLLFKEFLKIKCIRVTMFNKRIWVSSVHFYSMSYLICVKEKNSIKSRVFSTFKPDA